MFLYIIFHAQNCSFIQDASDFPTLYFNDTLVCKCQILWIHFQLYTTIPEKGENRLLCWQMDTVCSKQASAQLCLSELKASHLQPWSRKNIVAWTENSSHFSSERLLYFKETININTTTYNKKYDDVTKKKLQDYLCNGNSKRA